MVGGIRVAPEAVMDAADAAERGVAVPFMASSRVQPEPLNGDGKGKDLLGDGERGQQEHKMSVGAGRGDVWSPAEATPHIAHGPTKELYIPLKV